MVSDIKKRRLSALVLALAATFLVVELVVCLWFPSAWRHYTDYVGARFGGPLAALLLGMVLFALVVGLLWSRHKTSNIAAVCLILSVILHMLTVTVFGLWVVRQKMIELAHQPEDRYELSWYHTSAESKDQRTRCESHVPRQCDSSRRRICRGSP